MSVTASKTGAYTAAPNEVVPCDATGGAFSVALPLPINGVGQAPITIGPKLDATGNAVTVTTPAGTIKGSASLAVQFDVVTYVSNGVDWLATTHDSAGGGSSPVYGPPAGWVGAEAFQAFVALPTNRCYLYRCRGGGTITGITMWISMSSGNISVGVVGSAGGVAPTVTRRATSGAIPCPAAGYAVVTIASTVVDPSDYLALSQDDGVATFAAGPAGVVSEHFANPFVGSGQMYFMSAAHPVPATVTVGGTLVSGGHILSGA